MYVSIANSVRGIPTVFKIRSVPIHKLFYNETNGENTLSHQTTCVLFSQYG